MSILRRRLNQAISLLTGVRQIRSANRDGPNTLWIGDSHARFNLGHGRLSRRLARIDSKNFVWSIGPRLAYSITRKGWPVDVRVGARLTNQHTRTPNETVFVLGEIDIRMFLSQEVAKASVSLDFLQSYLARCQELACLQRRRPVVAVPIPPSSWLDLDFSPGAGPTQDRLAAHVIFRQQLFHLAARNLNAPIAIFDCSNTLSDENGLLNEIYTDDGCHLNDAGALLYRKEWSEFRSNLP